MSEHRHLLKSASLISAFTTAYRIPNLLRRLVGEGAVSAAFIPVFTYYIVENREEDGWEFANTTLTLITLFLTAVTVAGILLSPWLVRLFASGFGATPGKLQLTSTLNRIMFPYIC